MLRVSQVDPNLKIGSEQPGNQVVKLSRRRQNEAHTGLQSFKWRNCPLSALCHPGLPCSSLLFLPNFLILVFFFFQWLSSVRVAQSVGPALFLAPEAPILHISACVCVSR